MNLPIPKITACLLAKNEADRLPRTLAAVAPMVDQTIVLDAESVDDTVSVARTLGAEVHVEPWGGYVAARKHLVELARNDWILMIDADEVPQDEFWDELRHVDWDCDGFELRRRMIYLGRRMRFAWQPDWKLALFNRASATVVGGAVHERVEVDGIVRRLGSELLHYSYRSLDDHRERIRRYAKLAAGDLVASGYKANIPGDLFLRPLWHGLRQLVLKGAILDGYRGWLAAGSAVYNAWLRYYLVRQANRASS